MTTTKPFAITLDPGSSLANHTGTWRTQRPVYVDRLPPCNIACPAGEDIQGWLYHAESGDYEAAWRTLTLDNPLPAVMGRVCYRPCEDACNRSKLDAAVGINSVERFLGDEAIKHGWKFAAPGMESVKRVLVIGAGPSGLSAAYHLRRLGYRVRIAEAGPLAGGMHDLLRRCALAVLTSGSTSDDPRAAAELYPDFDIQVLQQDRGVRIDLVKAPAMAFVDGEIIRGVAELLFAVVRDLAYTAIELRENTGSRDLSTSEGITDAVFGLLRNARILHPIDPNLVVCWGGHSINRDEYLYTKQVGYELGLRGLDICTGCGPGAMKGPMKGATIAHAKQRHRRMRYIGITEPGIIAAESPNPIVNHLVIMPDIEKRLEAFVRMGHGIIVFPGGVGTAEEILYLLGILLREENAGLPFPLILTGPAASAPYFEQIDKFLRLTLGDAATSRYEIIVNDPAKVSKRMAAGVRKVREYRIAQKDSFFFNWSLEIPLAFQQPFIPTHEAMAALDLHHGRKPHELAADLRRAFSGIVAGNVKEDGLRRIEQFGPFKIHGDTDMMQSLDALLRAFVEQRRMKISGAYRPCYEVIA